MRVLYFRIPTRMGKISLNLFCFHGLSVGGLSWVSVGMNKGCAYLYDERFRCCVFGLILWGTGSFERVIWQVHYRIGSIMSVYGWVGYE